MFILLTCPFGLSHILATELKRLGYKPFDTFDTGTYIQGNWEDIYRCNLRSRIANKVYLLAGQKLCETIETYADFCKDISRSSLISSDLPCSVKAIGEGDIFRSPTMLQSITHKMISTSLGVSLSFCTSAQEEKTEIFVRCIGTHAQVRVNTSGVGLYQRGYKTDTTLAPLKENIAAGILLLTGRRCREPLLDPCCGSGTICIEAALIARNIAPGKRRSFAFQNFPSYTAEIFATMKQAAAQEEYEKSYAIVGSDIDQDVLTHAKKHADQAGVSDTIVRKEEDVRTCKEASRIVTNPPYGKRIATENIEALYTSLFHHYKKGTKGGIFTSYPVSFASPRQKLINNNGEKCILYMW